MKLTQEQQTQIIDIIKDYTDAEITLDTELTTQLGLSSFDAVMIIDAVNENLGLDIKPNILYECKTVGDLLEKVEQ